MEGLTWEDAQGVIRELMLAQPRGYQSRLARTLKTTRGYVHQVAQGRKPIRPEHLPSILDSLGLAYEINLWETT